MNDSEQVEFEFPQGNDVLKRLQAIEFDMAVSIKEIFEKNNIRYVIEYGSLLGAVRHKGFIPWDDDFDFVVFEEDYERASDSLRKELPSQYILHDIESDPKYFYSFSKVRHLYSIAVEDGLTDELKYKGISADLFKGRIEMNNKFARKLFLAKCHTFSHLNKFRQKKSILEFVKTSLNGIKTCYYIVLHFITPKTEYFHKSPETDQYFTPLDKYLPLSKVRFNGVDFCAPHDPEFVLTDRFGDWRSYPKQISFHIKSVQFLSEI